MARLRNHQRVAHSISYGGDPLPGIFSLKCLVARPGFLRAMGRFEKVKKSLRNWPKNIKNRQKLLQKDRKKKVKNIRNNALFKHRPSSATISSNYGTKTGDSVGWDEVKGGYVMGVSYLSSICLERNNDGIFDDMCEEIDKSESWMSEKFHRNFETRWSGKNPPFFEFPCEDYASLQPDILLETQSPRFVTQALHGAEREGGEVGKGNNRRKEGMLPEIEKNDPGIKKNDHEMKNNDPEIEKNDPEIEKNDPEMKKNDPKIESKSPEISGGYFRGESEVLGKSEEKYETKDEPEKKYEEEKFGCHVFDETDCRVDYPGLDYEAECVSVGVSEGRKPDSSKEDGYERKSKNNGQVIKSGDYFEEWNGSVGRERDIPEILRNGARLRISEGGMSSEGEGVSKGKPYHPRENGGKCFFAFCCIFVAELAVNFDSGAIPAVLVSIKDTYKMTDVEQGLLGALPYIGLVLACPVVGRLLQHFRTKPVLCITMAGNCASTALLAGSVNRAMLFTSRFLIGATQAAFVIYAPVWVDEFAPESRATMWMGMTQGATGLGVMLGYLVAGYMRPVGWEYSIVLQSSVLFIISILLCLAPEQYIEIYKPDQHYAPMQQTPKKNTRNSNNTQLNSLKNTKNNNTETKNYTNNTPKNTQQTTQKNTHRNTAQKQQPSRGRNGLQNIEENTDKNPLLFVNAPAHTAPPHTDMEHKIQRIENMEKVEKMENKMKNKIEKMENKMENRIEKMENKTENKMGKMGTEIGGAIRAEDSRLALPRSPNVGNTPSTEWSKSGLTSSSPCSMRISEFGLEMRGAFEHISSPHMSSPQYPTGLSPLQKIPTTENVKKSSQVLCGIPKCEEVPLTPALHALFHVAPTHCSHPYTSGGAANGDGKNEERSEENKKKIGQKNEKIGKKNEKISEEQKNISEKQEKISEEQENLEKIREKSSEKSEHQEGRKGEIKEGRMEGKSEKTETFVVRSNLDISEGVERINETDSTTEMIYPVEVGTIHETLRSRCLADRFRYMRHKHSQQETPQQNAYSRYYKQYFDSSHRHYPQDPPSTSLQDCLTIPRGSITPPKSPPQVHWVARKISDETSSKVGVARLEFSKARNVPPQKLKESKWVKYLRRGGGEDGIGKTSAVSAPVCDVKSEKADKDSGTSDHNMGENLVCTQIFKHPKNFQTSSETNSERTNRWRGANFAGNSGEFFVEGVSSESEGEISVESVGREPVLSKSLAGEYVRHTSAGRPSINDSSLDIEGELKTHSLVTRPPPEEKKNSVIAQIIILAPQSSALNALQFTNATTDPNAIICTLKALPSSPSLRPITFCPVMKPENSTPLHPRCLSAQLVQPPKLSTMQCVIHLLRSPIYFWVTWTLCALFFVVTGIQFWATRYLEEVIGVDPKVVLPTFCATAASAPMLGVVCGGILVDKIGGYKTTQGLFRALMTCAVLAGLCAALGAVVGFLNQFPAIIGLIWLILFFGAGILPAATGIIIAAVNPQIRAFASAFSMTLYNIFGYVMGTFLPGAIMSVWGLENGMRTIFFWSFFGFFGICLATLIAYRMKFAAGIISDPRAATEMEA